MTSKIMSVGLLTIMLVFSLGESSYLSYESSQFNLVVSQESCQRALYPEELGTDGRSHLIQLGSSLINGTGPREFFKRAGRSEASIVNALINNHIFYNSLTSYPAYFKWRYGFSLGQVMETRNITTCKPCKSATLYPNLDSNPEKIVARYKTVSDEFDLRPQISSYGPDGYRFLYTGFNDQIDNTKEEDIFCLSKFFNTPQQAFCMQIQLDKAEQNMRPFFSTTPGDDERIDRSRKMMIDWLPQLNLPELYGYVSFMAYVSYGTTILDIYQSCSEGLYDTSDSSEDISTNP